MCQQNECLEKMLYIMDGTLKMSSHRTEVLNELLGPLYKITNDLNHFSKKKIICQFFLYHLFGNSKM